MKRKIFKILAVLIAVIIAVLATLWFILKDQFAVMNAVINEDRETISYYIDEKGFNPNDMYGDINLIIYYIGVNRKSSDIDFIRFLLDKGININYSSKYWKLTPLLGAILADRNDIVNLFIEYDNSVINQNKNGKSPLGASLRLFNCEIAKSLINNGATLDNDIFKEIMKERLEKCKANNWVSTEKTKLD